MQLIIVEHAISCERSQDSSYGSDHSFPYPTHMAGRGRVKCLLNFIVKEKIINLVLIPLLY